MRFTAFLRLGLVFCICSVACKKVATAPKSDAAIINYSSADVYVAGTVTAKLSSGFTTEAAYWKDGVLTVLGDGTMTSSATGIAVSGNDVYVSGTVQPLTSLMTQACIWKNGVLQILSPDSAFSEATCIALRGGQVLVGGAFFENEVRQGLTDYKPSCVYWDNGIPIKIPAADYISSMAVSGQDLYVAGGYLQPFTYVGKDTLGGGIFAAYWKNDDPPVYLVQPNQLMTISGVTGIAVNGQNVYAAGFATAAAASDFWNNGALVQLSQSNYNGNAAAIAVNGYDVYIGGNLIVNGNPSAAYWKNNVVTMLSASAVNSLASSQVNAIAVNGTDVYAAGSLTRTQTSYQAAVLWKNGSVVQLPDGGNLGAATSAIFVVPK